MPPIAENARRPSTFSVVSENRCFPSNLTVYPVSPVFSNSSMRPTRKILRQRCIFSAAAIAMIGLISAVYVFITLPMQSVPPVDALPPARRDSWDERTSADDQGESALITRGLPSLFEQRRSSLKRLLDDDAGDPVEIVDSTTLKENGYSSYIRLVRGLRDLNDFLADASDTVPREAIVAHAQRYTRSLEKVADQIDEQYTRRRARDVMSQLSRNFREALDRLQFPANCSEAQAVLCDLTNPHGFASGISDALHCLLRGLQRNRTVVLRTTNWHYTRDLEWGQVFEPLSGCTEKEVIQPIERGYPETWNLERRHMARLPNTIAKDLVAFHGDPYAWFHGASMSYLLRPSKGFEKILNQHLRSMFPDGNYISMHIRRSDKGTEAKFRGLASYMRYAEEYFRRELLRETIKEMNIYVATDDTGVLEDLRKNYPKFRFFSNPRAAQEASRRETRDSKQAFEDVLLDLHTLSRSQHLICTLSSGFGRVAYELMNQYHHDAWRRVSSLDTDYIYAFAFFPERLPYEPMDGAVFQNEVAAAESPAEKGKSLTDSYSLAAAYITGWSKRSSGPDGFVPTHDRAHMVPKFKTEQAFRSSQYAAHIAPISNTDHEL
ncbi:alpha-(1,6)-fucosyltransferase [Galendromus occidentalis]|uniref:Alpha-(1,6)-fucosyltransferase n=1 Tax=Galendromus occidentalis TaxID=34638 RepID=A0AAJ7PA25_9ACAR|nr:alpha-(1,6)-fucosyltransferase [Galendromus occidentalis]